MIDRQIKIKIKAPLNVSRNYWNTTDKEHQKIEKIATGDLEVEKSEMAARDRLESRHRDAQI